MNTRNLTDLTLVLANDTTQPATWLSRWAVSYPDVQCVAVAHHDTPQTWQKAFQTAFATIVPENQVAVVAYGAAANAMAEWYTQAHIMQQRRFAATILVSPLRNLPVQHVFFNHKTALVIPQEENDASWFDSAQDWANLWHARLLIAPQTGQLRHVPDGWQWGMQLLQEMLLAP